MFTVYPDYSPYRTLQLSSPLQHGEDVYALQTALNECKFNCGKTDGVFGNQTMSAVRAAQKAYFLVVDGKAGGVTQRALALAIAEGVSAALHVPYSGLRGQLELESGYRLGNYSPMRPDKSYDAGVAQRNTKFTSPVGGFDAKASIVELATVLSKHFFLFERLPTHRRWSLAQGAWNAPAFACYIAREEGATKVTVRMILRPSEEQRNIFLTYVDNASVYLTV